MKLKLALLVGLFAFGYAMSASAGAVTDGDGDLVPDQFDNCSTVANGPNQTTNQVDSDLDGYGNRCDTDYNNDLNTTAGGDFSVFLSTFNTSSLGETDHDGNGSITAADFSVFLSKFTSPPGAPGPSGLACAGTEPCTP
jgi:Thrombospondin type 3 repeat